MAKKAKSIPTSRLGRGLSSLIGDPAAVEPIQPDAVPARGEFRPPSPTAEPAGPPRELPTHQIAPNPYQPRHTFDAAELDELVASVSRQGILQPLLVAPATDPAADRPYVLIAGERRLRAARKAGLPTVPCAIRDAGPEQLLEWSLVENIQRSDLNPIERARAYRGYMDRFGLTQAELASRTGDSRPTVANYLRLLDLCDLVQQLLLDRGLTFGHARALAALAGQEQRQAALARRIVRDGLSVRQAEQLAAELQRGPAGGAAGDRPAPKERPAYVADVEDRLTRAVGTRVQVVPGRAKNRGKIVVDYYSLDDFDRIARALGLQEE